MTASIFGLPAPSPRWRDRAACLGADPDLFFPQRGESAEPAREICAQCLQPHRDPVSGKVSYVFSCFNQDQPLDVVDWQALDQRLRQNSVQEKLTALWISHCLHAKAAA